MHCAYSDDYRFCQLIIDVISAVLDGDHTAAFQMGDDCYRLAAVAAEGKKEGLQLLVISFYPLNYIFLAYYCRFQIHLIHPFQHFALPIGKQEEIGDRQPRTQSIVRHF